MGFIMYKRILALRKKHNLTQKQISQIIGCSQRAYCHYEQGKRRIPIPFISKLADYYNVSVDYIIGRVNHSDL